MPYITTTTELSLDSSMVLDTKQSKLSTNHVRKDLLCKEHSPPHS